MATLKDVLTATRLRSLLRYEPETGVFVWLVSRGRVRAGEIAGSNVPNWYTHIGIDGKTYRAHRLAWLYMTGAWPSRDTDHRNRVKSDNRFENLRDIGRSGNMQNVVQPQANNICGALGVSKNGKAFRCRISVDGKRKHVGTFPTINDAHAAYLEAKRTLHPNIQ